MVQSAQTRLLRQIERQGRTFPPEADEASSGVIATTVPTEGIINILKTPRSICSLVATRNVQKRTTSFKNHRKQASMQMFFWLPPFK